MIEVMKRDGEKPVAYELAQIQVGRWRIGYPEYLQHLPTFLISPLNHQRGPPLFGSRRGPTIGRWTRDKHLAPRTFCGLSLGGPGAPVHLPARPPVQQV